MPCQSYSRSQEAPRRRSTESLSANSPPGPPPDRSVLLPIVGLWNVACLLPEGNERAAHGSTGSLVLLSSHDLPGRILLEESGQLRVRRRFESHQVDPITVEHLPPSRAAR